MKINIAKLTTKGIERIESIEIGVNDYYEIPLEDNNKYMEHKRKRNKVKTVGRSRKTIKISY